MRLLFSRLFLNMCCLLNSCLHQSFELRSLFLICDVWWFRNERDLISFKTMVILLTRLSWSVLLGLLLWWHRELFFGWNTVGANVGVSESLDKIPENVRENSKLVRAQWWRKRRQRVSHRLLKPPKLWIHLHVPSRPLL
jgi:hypothetical protein